MGFAKLETIVRFVDIGETVYHHCLNFLFIIRYISCVKPVKRAVVYFCVRDIDLTSSTILIFDFGSVPTMCYFFFFFIL